MRLTKEHVDNMFLAGVRSRSPALFEALMTYEMSTKAGLERTVRQFRSARGVQIETPSPGMVYLAVASRWWARLVPGQRRRLKWAILKVLREQAPVGIYYVVEVA